MARKTIVQRISLEGAEAIKASLASLGGAAGSAFDKFEEIKKANTGLAAFGSSLKETAAAFGKWSQSAKTAAADGAAFGSAVGSAIGKLTLATGGLVAAGSKLVGVFKTQGAETESLTQQAEAVNLTTQEFESFRNVLQTAGVESGEASSALQKLAKFMRNAADQNDDYQKKLKKLNKEFQEGKIEYKEYNERLTDLNDGMGEAAKITDRYGLKVRDANGQLKKATDFALEFGQAQAGASDKTRVLAESTEVFGKAGSKIAGIFRTSSAEFKSLVKEANAIAPVQSKVAIALSLAMDDAFDKMGLAARALQRDVVGIFAPEVTKGIGVFQGLIVSNRDKIIQLAVTLREQLQPAFDKFLLSLVSADAGTFLDKAFKSAEDGVKALGQALDTIIIPSFKALKAAADTTAAAINKVFGTELTGGALLAGLAIAKFTGLLTVFTTGVKFASSAILLLVRNFALFVPILRTLAIALLSPAGAFILLGIAVGVLVGLFIKHFATIKKTVIDAFKDPLATIRSFITTAGAILREFIGNIALLFGGDPFKAMAAFDAIVAAVVALPGQVVALFQSMVAGISATWESIKQGASDAWQWVKDRAGEAYQYVIDTWNGVGEWFTEKWEQLKQLFADGWQFAKDKAGEYFDYISSRPAAAFAAIKNAAADMWTAVKGYWNDLIAKAKEYFGLQAAAGAGGGAGDGAQSNAAGGMIRGRGTGTSDSILSWLSNGEFVVKAKAVKHYGPQLLHALNSMKLPAFNTGGLVPAMQRVVTPSIPRFAGGGMAISGGSNMRPFVLNIGGESFTGLKAPQSAIESLTRYSSGKQMRSAGKKPSWYKG